MPDTLKVLIADPIHEDGQKQLAGMPGLAIEVATGLDEAGLVAKIPGFDAIIVRSKSRVTKPVIEAGTSLKAIGRAGIGIDNIDVDAATERGIVVFNTPDANATTTAELTLTHILSLSRHLPRADRSVRNGEWTPTKYVGTEIAGKTIGVFGFGTIGRLVAERCAALKMKVLGYDPFVAPEIMQQHGVQPQSLDDMLTVADYITLHCPLTEKTRNVLDAERIASMKRGARIINCARGGLVDETALLNALKSGQLAGAALDVFVKEPPKDSPLLQLDNVTLTPHLGASTEEAQQAVSTEIAQLIGGFLVSGEAESAVNLPRIPADQLVSSKPYQNLAHALGRLVGEVSGGPVNELIVRTFGRASEFDSRPVGSAALVGLLSRELTDRVNRVNAAHLARSRGIAMRISQSEDSRDYVSLIEVSAVTGDKTTTVSGTLLGGRLPRIVRIDGYAVEVEPKGHFLFTRHHDRPGVVGALGGILGREGINIHRMTVGLNGDATSAIALIGVSSSLSEPVMKEIRAMDPIIDAVGFAL